MSAFPFLVSVLVDFFTGCLGTFFLSDLEEETEFLPSSNKTHLSTGGLLPVEEEEDGKTEPSEAGGTSPASS